jgi:tripartite-type tricarboxylate transporter receptor subunit TctC
MPRAARPISWAVWWPTFLSKDLKQTVIVENKAGAQGAIGAEMVARAEPDGYTLFTAAASIIVLNPLLYKKLSYDPVKDFRMLALVTDGPVVMEINLSVPAKTVAEFVAYAKQSLTSGRREPAAPFIWPARCSSRSRASR